jgi:acyl-homoserine-lactone acylase
MGVALLACTSTTATAGAAKVKAPVKATIRWASHGIPHILAKNWDGLGYGYGYALAKLDICPVADQYMTVRAERSKYIGPTGSWTFKGNGTTQTNLNSDFFFQKIIDTKVIEKLLAQPAPLGPRPEVKDVVRGYVQGYNRYLADVGGSDGVTDPACKGKPWVQPIAEIDAYRRFYELALMASQAVAIDGIGGAQPLIPGVDLSTTADKVALLQDLKSKLPLGGIGSNAVALGSRATADHRGLLLGNPHFPWDGSERFFQAQLTIPGKIDVAGASLLGVPVVLIGHTRNLAWSHTVSAAFRFTPYELKLVPGSPTTYLLDGKPTPMTHTDVTVQVKQADGSLKPQTRRLYDTVWGPMTTSVLGLPLFPWTPVLAYAMADANAANFRYLNHFFEVDRAQSTNELKQILDRNLGIPWVNTIASDSDGHALYADIGAIPNVPNDLAAKCVNGALGVVAKSLLGLPVLDGSTTGCAWRNDPDAVAKGIFGPSHLPFLFRDDYVTNSNDSYWLSNPHQPLEGFAGIIGKERSVRSLRTRNGLTMVEDVLKNGGTFTLAKLRDLVFNNRQYAGVLWKDELVRFCQANPTLIGTSGIQDVSAACPVIAAWDGHDDLDSHGALLFRRFVEHALLSISVVPLGNPFSVPFDANDPVNTPRGLNIADPITRTALADAVNDLRSAKIPLDASLRGYQYEKRGQTKIPIHGGPGVDGDFNAINVRWTPGQGYVDVPHGSSYVQAVQLRGRGRCPISYSILTYSQSVDPTSPYFGDQTEMFSHKQWNPMRFCEASLKRDPDLRIQRLRVSRR